MTSIHTNTVPERSDVVLGWLQQAAIDIRAGRITMKQAAKTVHFTTLHGEIIQERSVSTLKRMFSDNGIHVCEKYNKGHEKDFSDAVEAVFEILEQFPVGKNKVYEILKRENKGISYYQVNKVFEKYIYPENIDIEKTPTQRPRCRYVMDKVGACWHGDIHYVFLHPDTVKQEIRYLFALIDDCSRYIVGYGLYSEKTAANVKQTFIEAVETHGTPMVYWCDNGGENTADLMKKFLLKNQIHLVTTLPGNPAANGKIERFWRFIDSYLKFKPSKNWEQIEKNITTGIKHYNNAIPHFGLKKEGGAHLTPQAVFTNESLRAITIDDCHIIIDNKGEIPLKDFLRIDDEKETHEEYNLNEI